MTLSNCRPGLQLHAFRKQVAPRKHNSVLKRKRLFPSWDPIYIKATLNHKIRCMQEYTVSGFIAERNRWRPTSNREVRGFAFWDFYWISENFVFQFSWKAGEMVFLGDSSLLERSGIIFGRATGTCVSKPKSSSEDFRELRPPDSGE